MVGHAVARAGAAAAFARATTCACDRVRVACALTARFDGVSLIAACGRDRRHRRRVGQRPAGAGRRAVRPASRRTRAASRWPAGRCRPIRAPGSPRASARIPEDRHAVGAIGDLPLWENAIAEHYRTRFARGGVVRRGAGARLRAQRSSRRFDVRAARGIDTPTRTLSGGNMQKLILGRALAGGEGAATTSTPDADRRQPADLGTGHRCGRLRPPAAARRLRAGRGGAADLGRPGRDLRAGRSHRGDARRAADRGTAARPTGTWRRSDWRWRARPSQERRMRLEARGEISPADAGRRAVRRGGVHAGSLFAVRRLGRRAARANLRADLRGRIRFALRLERDADASHAADLHRPGGGGGIPRALLQHRRGRPALRRRAGRGGGGRPARRQRVRRCIRRCSFPRC